MMKRHAIVGTWIASVDVVVLQVRDGETGIAPLVVDKGYNFFVFTKNEVATTAASFIISRTRAYMNAGIE